MRFEAAQLANVGRSERVARVAIGTLLVAVGALVIVGGAPLYGRLGALLLLNCGLNLTVTGITGYCPLNEQLGRSIFAVVVHGPAHARPGAAAGRHANVEHGIAVRAGHVPYRERC